VVARAMERHPQHRYADAASMRAALEWLDIESAKRNPQTQDIAPWMETSHIGSVPVSALASTYPPVQAQSSHPTGAVLSTSGARPIPIAPVVVEELDGSRRDGVRLGLLLVLLGTLVFSGYWYRAQVIPTDSNPPLGLTPESSRAE
jgi:hypothetical protein